MATGGQTHRGRRPLVVALASVSLRRPAGRHSPQADCFLRVTRRRSLLVSLIQSHCRFTVDVFLVDKVPRFIVCYIVLLSGLWAPCWPASVTAFLPVLISDPTVGPRGRQRPADRLGQLAARQRNAPPSTGGVGARQATPGGTQGPCGGGGTGTGGRARGGGGLDWLS